MNIVAFLKCRYFIYTFFQGFRCQSSLDVESFVKEMCDDSYLKSFLKTPIIREEYQLKHENITLTEDLLGEV